MSYVTLCFYLFIFLQVQLTDFENSAYVVFIVLLTRVILSYKLDFLIPLSKVGFSVLFACVCVCVRVFFNTFGILTSLCTAEKLILGMNLNGTNTVYILKSMMK